MEAKKTVFKIHITCTKCKTSIMKVVSKLEGINEMTIDADKGTLTVVGIVDPVCVVDQLRKAGKSVTIDSVGPAKKEEPKKKPESPKKPLVECCLACRPSPYVYVISDSAQECTIA